MILYLIKEYFPFNPYLYEVKSFINIFVNNNNNNNNGFDLFLSCGFRITKQKRCFKISAKNRRKYNIHKIGPQFFLICVYVWHRVTVMRYIMFCGVYLSFNNCFSFLLVNKIYV